MLTNFELTFLNLICAAIMCGVIWVIQILHYPSFDFIDLAKFLEFHHLHSARISYIVAPIMIIELLRSAILFLNNSSAKLLLVNLVLVILIWLSTFFLSVPLHNKLAQGPNLEVIKSLVQTNWPRTILWTIRLVAMSIFTLQNLRIANV